MKGQPTVRNIDTYNLNVYLCPCTKFLQVQRETIERKFETVHVNYTKGIFIPQRVNIRIVQQRSFQIV